MANKKYHVIASLLLTPALFVSNVVLAQNEAASSCGVNSNALQILGSGGPFGNGRASASYLVWVDGQSKLMVDAGGGSFAHFHEAGASLADLELLAISHFHPDHSAEVPALLWPLNGNLRIAGPSGTADFPSLNEYLNGLFGPSGVFRVINQRFQFEPITVDANAVASTILSQSSIFVSAQGVPHGDVPALAYKAVVGDVSLVFSSDQNGSDPQFIEFARNADILVVHFAGNEDGSGRGDLHAKPSVWGNIATEADVKHLVLSHLSANQNFEANLAALKNAYSGPVTVAQDLMCLPL